MSPPDTGTEAGAFPPLRLHPLNDAPLRPDRGYVLYWMVANRRLGWSFALDRAVEHATRLRRPLLILEALRVGYPWASARHHAFALDGMAEHRRVLAGSGVGHHAYVEPVDGAGKGLLEALAADAVVVVTDDAPVFFLPRMQEAAASRLDVRMEAVDSCGLLPLRATAGPFAAAYPFRRFLQRNLPEHLFEMPHPNPLHSRDFPAFTSILPEVEDRWPAASDGLVERTSGALDRLPLSLHVAPTRARGGTAAARDRLETFLDTSLLRYAEAHNDPDADATSGLSPWLHWGHVSVHEIFRAVAEREGWSPARLGTRAHGRRHGWWGMGTAAEAFLDELVTWRELGFVYCHHEPRYDRWETLPLWARETLESHADDPRDHVYDMETFDAAGTHDPLWNAAQNELRTRGGIHNYLRMLWGKKILEWTRHPGEALEIMVELNNRYALDGRDPNSYSGIFWVLGRFDRGWPERPVYGKVRSMSSDATRRKVSVRRYLDRWAP